METNRYCTRCGALLTDGDRFCSECGAPVAGGETAPPDSSAMGPATAAGASPEKDAAGQATHDRDADAGPDELAWSVDVPLISNPLIMGQLALCLGGGLLVLFLLMIGLAAYEQQWRHVVMAFKVTGIAAAFITGLALFSIFVVLRNRIAMQFAVTRRGVGSFVASGRAKAAAGAAQVIGAVQGNPTVVGAGLLAEAKRAVLMDWEEIEEIRLLPRSHTIVVRNTWRPVISVHATPDNWDAVVAAMERGVAASRAAREERKRAEQADGESTAAAGRLARLLLLAAAAIAGSALLFRLPAAVSPSPPWLWTASIGALASVLVRPLRRPAGALAVVALLAIAGLTLHAGLTVHHTPRFTAKTGYEIEYDPAKYAWSEFGTFESREWGQTCLGGLGWVLLAGLAATSLRRQTA